MKKIIFFLFFFLLTIIQAEVIVGVADFENYSKATNLNSLQKGVPDAIINQLVTLKGLKIVERSQFKSVLNELQLSLSGLASDMNVQKIGKQLTANIMIVGGYEYNAITKYLRINARIVNVETGLIIDSETVIDLDVYSDDLQKNIAIKLKDFLKKNYDLTESEAVPTTKRMTQSEQLKNSQTTPPPSNIKELIQLLFEPKPKTTQSVKGNTKNFASDFYLK